MILLGAMGAPARNSPHLPLRVLLRDGMGIIRTNHLTTIPISLVVVPLLRHPVPVLVLPDPRSLR